MQDEIDDMSQGQYPNCHEFCKFVAEESRIACGTSNIEGVVNCQNSWDKGPPEGNSARG